MIYESVNMQLRELRSLLNNLSATAYNHKSAMLGNASVGQHVRHILELLQCLVHGYENGIVNYDARKRDVRIETDIDFAIDCIVQVQSSIDKADKPLLLHSNEIKAPVNTFYLREIIYNTEHAIHHMALIRVALREMQLEIVNDNFGVAPSTIQYRKETCAQYPTYPAKVA